jgi:hypothetical protein
MENMGLMEFSALILVATGIMTASVPFCIIGAVFAVLSIALR